MPMSGTAHALKASSLEVHSSASKEVSKSHMTVEAQEHADVCQDLSNILANYRRPPSPSTSRSPGRPTPHIPASTSSTTPTEPISPRRHRYLPASSYRAQHINVPQGYPPEPTLWRFPFLDQTHTFSSRPRAHRCVSRASLGSSQTRGIGRREACATDHRAKTTLARDVPSAYIAGEGVRYVP